LVSAPISKATGCHRKTACQNDVIGRYILRFRGRGPKPAEDVRQIRSVRGARVIDESERMMLVEAPDGELRKLMSGLSHWVMGDEQTIPLPDPRQRPS
jgi:hypothetical protein